MVSFITNIICDLIGMLVPSNHCIQSACVCTLFGLCALALCDQLLANIITYLKHIQYIVECGPSHQSNVSSWYVMCELSTGHQT
jgi:hypothetical protein